MLTHGANVFVFRLPLIRLNRFRRFLFLNVLLLWVVGNVAGASARGRGSSDYGSGSLFLFRGVTVFTFFLVVARRE